MILKNCQIKLIALNVKIIQIIKNVLKYLGLLLFLQFNLKDLDKFNKTNGENNKH
jgi:hypothetical protein